MTLGCNNDKGEFRQNLAIFPGIKVATCFKLLVQKMRLEKCISSMQEKKMASLIPCLKNNELRETSTKSTVNGPAQTMEPPGHKPLLVNILVLGPFEEEEKGISIASDVVKMQGEDPDTPGYLRGDGARGEVGGFKSWMRPALACS